MTESDSKTKRYKTKAPTRGGAREGAGRPKGTSHKVTVQGLLQTLAAKTRGKNYEDLLIDDFLAARQANDTNLMLKYHNLLSNKVLATLNSVEVTDTEDTVAAKQAAFAAALATLQKRSAESDNN
jgi:hypothetical protein